MESSATVFLVDDDKNVRDAVAWMLRAVGLRVESYASPSELLDASRPERPGCFVLDLQLPGMSGFELRKRLWEKGCRQPFIIVSGHGDISLAVQAMRLGAVDFIEKPFHHQRLLDCVQKGVERDLAERRHRAGQADTQAHLDSLTAREREVLDLVVTGKLSKKIASELGISTKTVEVHRSNIMKKMAVDSVAQLVHRVTKHSVLV
jgi:two-component system, LuxR family, response regulator FixJ